jgi:protein SCO1/2
MTARSIGAVMVLLLFVCVSANAQDPPSGILTEIGIDQKLDAQLPLDTVLRDENGKDVALRDLFHGKPVILNFVYYECPMLCSMALNGLLHSMKPLTFSAGKEFEVLTVSIDSRESSELAAAKKAAYLKVYDRPGAEDGWRFLTGDTQSIERLTDAAGYRYKWDKYTKQWAHISALIVVTPEGRISQYLYGIEYSPRDVRLSLVQASQNRIGTVVDRVLMYCYHYDPVTGKYGFVIMDSIRIAGFATVGAIAAFIFLAVRRERRLLGSRS